jgi:hypothetical protein
VKVEVTELPPAVNGKGLSTVFEIPQVKVLVNVGTAFLLTVRFAP